MNIVAVNRISLLYSSYCILMCSAYADLEGTIREDIIWTEVQMVEYPTLQAEAEVGLYTVQ